MSELRLPVSYKWHNGNTLVDRDGVVVLFDAPQSLLEEIARILNGHDQLVDACETLIKAATNAQHRAGNRYGDSCWDAINKAREILDATGQK